MYDEHMSVEEPDAFVLRETDGAVVTLTLNRPRQFNPLSSGMISALQCALDDVSADPDLRVVVIAGAGRAFSAGHDLREIRAHPDERSLALLFAKCSRLMLTIAELRQPVIARVHGLATAAGCQLVAACDLALAGRSATFATSGVSLGLFCSTPAVPLTRALAPKHAAELLYLGDSITAEQAERWGFVNRCVDDMLLVSETLVWARRIAAKSGPAIASGKQLLREQRNLSLSDAYALAGDNMASDMQNVDAQSGVDAFLDKRPPPQWMHR